MHESRQLTNTTKPSGFRGIPLVGLYVVISFLSAGLLLVIQPMASRLLLPSFGGSSAVWNTALVFFQTGLLAGYLYAHLASRTWLGNRWIHLGVMGVPLLLLPFGLPDFAEGTFALRHPTVAVLLALGVMVGAPYLAVSTMSPTIQRWFSRTGHALAVNPYPLYASSNAGSLLALLAYPALLEPAFDVAEQTRWFTYGYVVLVLLVAVAALRLPAMRHGVDSPHQAAKASWRQSLTWAYRAFVPSLLLLGVTRHLSTDVAAFPLLWVIPLALYLATFVLAFSGRVSGALSPASRILKLLVVPAVLAVGAEVGLLWLAVVLPLAVLTVTSFVAHLTLYETRPPPELLTGFYLWIAAGGAMGGVVGALVAPAVFKRVVEYPLALVLAATLVVGFRARGIRGQAAVLAAVGSLAVAAMLVDGGVVARLVLGGAALIGYIWAWSPAAFSVVLLSTALVAMSFGRAGHELVGIRTFYGVYRVVDDGSQHILTSGTTVHGVQWIADGALDGTALAYYHEAGPIGSVMKSVLGGSGARVGIVGLGVGSLAAYGRPGDQFTFFEIDPAVEAIAANTSLFDYLATSAASIDVVLGDGRLQLERSGGQFDLIVVDAFTSDSIPVHLLTSEAVELYVSRIAAAGLVALHISNRHLDLEPVLGRVAAANGLAAAIAEYQPDEDDLGASPSRWVVLSSDPNGLESLGPGWRKASSDAPLWTDAYSNVLSVIRWR